MASIIKRTKIDKETGKEIVLHWRAQDTINGKRVEFTGKTKKIVETKLENYKLQFHTYGNILSDESYTVAEWTYKHLFTIKIHEISVGTFNLYVMVYNKYIKPSVLGNTPLINVTQMQVQEFLNAQSHLAHSTIKKSYLVLSAAFESAIRNNLIRINPAKGVVVPNKKKPKRQVEILTKEQQRAYILATEKEPYRLLFLTALFTGLRQGELLALRWQNVNLKTGILKVCKTIRTYNEYDINGNYEKKLITKEPKTRSGIREVPLPSFLIDELSHIKPKGTVKDISSRYVFETPIGKSIPSRTIIDIHKRLCNHAKINPITTYINGLEHTTYRGINFHALRHTFTTRMIESGESIKTIQVLLSHADIQTTMNIYAHVLQDTKIASADRQNALYSELTS
ncbi:tyrosine-type recombinase/integrase [Cellulosilyticum ruminicola]|uniref:tyrosine-type recombinase/integrase n=1 Tax=Cellulosilyticum ruminicola TaxID=425254 RepID=UPI0006D1CA72|nr:site-specific integrase [Cellulosilyticum ruminicola]